MQSDQALPFRQLQKEENEDPNKNLTILNHIIESLFSKGEKMDSEKEALGEGRDWNLQGGLRRGCSSSGNADSESRSQGDLLDLAFRVLDSWMRCLLKLIKERLWESEWILLIKEFLKEF